MAQLPTTVKVRLSDEGVMPRFALDGDACADLRTRHDLVLEHGEFGRLWTGVSLELPAGWEAQIRGRSGLTSMGLLVSFGTVDSGYRGELAVMLMNLSGIVQVFRAGDRVAQLAVREVHPVRFVEVDALTPAVRGERGFGSTGK